MKALTIFTKPVNLADSLAVRWWGLSGARRFWLGWAAFMYAFLVFISGYALSALASACDDHDARFHPYLVATLIVSAASLLTRMLMRVLAELRLPTSEEPPGRESK